VGQFESLDTTSKEPARQALPSATAASTALSTVDAAALASPIDWYCTGISGRLAHSASSYGSVPALLHLARRASSAGDIGFLLEAAHEKQTAQLDSPYSLAAGRRSAFLA
jgi:hypothetical protein